MHIQTQGDCQNFWISELLHSDAWVVHKMWI